MLEKQAVIVLIEVMEVGTVQVTCAMRIVDDGQVISITEQRNIISPGDDYSQKDDRVKAVCAAVHTPEVVAAYQSTLAQTQEIPA
jgi:hypothetical protein